MAVTFPDDWAQEVADVSGDPEYQNAQIEIRNPELLVPTGPEPDMITTFEQATTGDPVVWSGRARIANSRSSFNAGGATSFDPTGMKAMLVQIPYQENFTRVRRGWEVRVTDGGRNHVLEQYLFTVDSDVSSSQVASLNFHCTINVESDPTWED